MHARHPLRVYVPSAICDRLQDLTILKIQLTAIKTQVPTLGKGLIKAMYAETAI